MAFENPPIAPQRGDRATFSPRVDTFLSWLVRFVPQLNSFVSGLTTLSAGGANAFAYTFDTATTDSDPGNGKVRFGSATQNIANMIRVDNLAANGGDVTAFMTALQAGTSNVKASLRLQKVSDPTTYLLFDITAVTAATGYLNLTVTPRTSSATSPFMANDTLILFFDPKGDKGDGGGTPTQQQIRDAIGTLGVGNGGTGATTAAAALANLGGASTAGATFTGPLTLANNVALTGKDAGGTSRQLIAVGSDNQVTMSVAGGVNLRILNQAFSQNLWSLDNSGNSWQFGNHTFEIGRGVILRDQGGTLRQFFSMGSDGGVSYTNAGGTYTRWLNQGFSQELMRISDNGSVTVPGSFSAGTVTETSDERKKNNWRVLTDAQIDALADMEKVGVFDWLDGTGAAVGASAQQIRAIVPEAVHEDGDGNLSVAYGGLAFAMAQGALRRAARP